MRITLSNRTRQELDKEIFYAKHLRRYNQIQVYRAIILLEKEYEVSEIAIILDKSERIIYYWICNFLLNGVKGLKYKKIKGRKSKLTKEEKNELKELIIKGSINSGYESVLWTSASIKNLIENKYKVDYALGYIPRLLKELSLSHKKIETISHKANKTKQENWEERYFIELSKKVIRERGKILFQDESTFLMWSQKGYSWGERGKRLEVKVNVSSEYSKVFGGIELTTGKLYYMKSKKGKKIAFLNYLEYLVEEFKGTKIYLILDNGTTHKNKEVKEYCDKNKDKIELAFLPPYSPKLNPIEKLWKVLKQKNMHGRYFESKEAFYTQLENGLNAINKNLSASLGVMSKWIEIYKFVEKTLTFKDSRWMYVNSLFDKSFA